MMEPVILMGYSYEPAFTNETSISKLSDWGVEKCEIVMRM